MNDRHLRKIDAASFADEVLGSSEPFVLELGAKWCKPCKVLEPMLDKLAREHEGRVRVGTLDVEEASAIASRYAVRGMPTVIRFEGGREVRRQVGLTNEAGLRAFFAS